MDLCSNICTKFYLSCVSGIDIQITNNLRDANIHTRPVKSNGLWCFILLPAVLILYTWLQDVSPLYRLIAYVSFGLMSYCALFIVFLSVSCLVIKENTYGGCIVSGLVSCIFICAIWAVGLVPSLLFAFLPIYLFSTLLRKTLISCPNTFTIGEAMVVIQSIVLFCTMAGASILYYKRTEGDFIDVAVYTVLSTVGLLVTALYFLPIHKRTMLNLFYIVTAGASFLIITWHLLLGRNCLSLMLRFVYMDQARVKLISFWLVLVILAVFVILARTALAVKADTATRKTFHLLASMVFMSGILADLELIKLAAGVGFGALLFVEALRKSNIEPISSALQSAFIVYSDEKDCGTFAMTPIYLFAGLACPLLLVPEGRGSKLELLSGVLAIGIGDTAASWFGSRYGQTKWPGGTRTLEGSAFNILSQIATVYALDMFDLLSVKNAMPRAVIAATVSGLVESQLEQVDNLILPLVTLIALQMTSFMSSTF